MIICRTIAALRDYRRQVEGTLGFVPTMGYLHEGHLSLVAAAQAQNDEVLVSSFVNPIQFNAASDLTSYPRDETRDLDLLRERGVEAVFIPDAAEIYPPDFQTYVNVEQLSQGLEGAYRAGHFRGVATVVCKFFNLVQPTRAYFGQKDAQQVRVIQQMVRDLAFPLEVVVQPTLRAADGLALSSRNARLSPAQGQAATVLSRALFAAQALYDSGERDPAALRAAMERVLAAEALARVDYVSVANADTLLELQEPSAGPILLSLAVFIGDVRLIDNLRLP